jgi:hypothetical protein
VTATAPIQNILVHRADSFRVVEGVNDGDAISVMDDLVPDDVYALEPDSPRARLALDMSDAERIAIAGTSETGTAGATLHLDCAVILMPPTGVGTDAIILVETDADARIAEVYLLPLAPLEPRTPYRLVNMERASAHRKFAQVACLAFARGTHITMASGEQVPVERLKPGDRVLTRDGGAQPVRWIGHSTVRAEGDFAPIVIKAGTLNNSGDLVVSPNHRLFVYQRRDTLGAGQAELMVKARHLVNGESVYVMRGGFVEYFQILLDSHNILYAEGIAAESFLVEPRTRPALPADLLARLSDIMPRDAGAHGLDVQRALLDRPDAIELLRRASAG